MRSDFDGRGAIVLERSWLADYVALTKPELTFLSVITALGGFFFGATDSFSGVLLLHTLVGTGLVGGGAGALNQYMERNFDAMMRRTEHRPLPSGRLSPAQVLIFGVACSILGILQLTLFVNILTGSIAAMTLVTYLFLYTPLKRITPLATIIGGIPGGLPPVMGWTAIRNDISIEPVLLFSVLFFWQMPHFLSLAWMYRKDYARAGYRTLSVLDIDGSITGRHMLVYCAVLIPITLLPGFLGYLGFMYSTAALVLGILFFLPAIQFTRLRSNTRARRVFIASLLYLPALFAFMVADRFW